MPDTPNILVIWGDDIGIARPTSSSRSSADLRRVPLRQKAATFTIDQAVAKLEATLTSGH